MISNGIDIIEIKRMEGIKRLDKIFTDKELEYYEKRHSIETLAGMYASKEAVLKSMGVGVEGYSLLDIEILHTDKYMPYLNFHGKLKKEIEENNYKFSLSISHDKNYAVASVIRFN